MYLGSLHTFSPRASTSSSMAAIIQSRVTLCHVTVTHSSRCHEWLCDDAANMCDCDSQHCDMMPKKLIGFCITSNTKTKLFFVWVRILYYQNKMCVCVLTKPTMRWPAAVQHWWQLLIFSFWNFSLIFFVTISHGCVTYFLCITTIHTTTTTTTTPISQRAAAAVCCCCCFFVVENRRTKVEEGKN